MIYSAKELEHFQIAARDGLLGTVHDVLFDADSWLARYFVVSTGPWLNRHVLLAASRLRISDMETRALSIEATQQQVRESPPANVERPLTRQQELAMHDHYGWPYYWSLAAMGSGVAPVTAGTTNAFVPGSPGSAPPHGAAAPRSKNPLPDPVLRSVRALRGYSIAASDAPVGEVDDLLFDHLQWDLRYVVVDTRRWLPGPKVLLSPGRIREIRPATLEIAVDLTRDQIKHGPPHDPGRDRNDIYSDRRYGFYGRTMP